MWILIQIRRTENKSLANSTVAMLFVELADPTSYQLRQLHPVVQSCSHYRCNADWYSHDTDQLSHRLLQLTAVWRGWRSGGACSVSSECRREPNGTKQCQHITVLRQLHWLPACKQIWAFKLLWLVFHLLLHVMAPAYLVGDCQMLSTGARRQLLSTTTRTCSVPRIYNTSLTGISGVAGPKLWNSLPNELRIDDMCFNCFKHRLKAFCLTAIEARRRLSLFCFLVYAEHKYSYVCIHQKKNLAHDFSLVLLDDKWEFSRNL